MKSQRKAGLPPAPAAGQKSSRAWLLFMHQLPATPSNLRVQTWRRLQQFGALPLKQAVYILPDTPATREDFEWLSAEVKAAGGEADIFIGAPANPWSDDAIIEEFRRSRQAAYVELARDLERTLKRLDGKKRPATTRSPAVSRLLEGFRQRLAAIERIDYFGAAGRDRVAQLVAAFEARVSTRPAGAADQTAGARNVRDYQQRLWVTRPRPGVDRMSSAWLIRRFIDSHARFAFAEEHASLPADAVPFDMFGVEFSHHGEHCTFETLCAVFGIHDATIARIAAIVHDLDLKDNRFAAAEAPTVAAMIDGLQLAIADDDRLLAEGMTLFESLYRSFEQSTRLAGPRALTRTRAGRKQT